MAKCFLVLPCFLCFAGGAQEVTQGRFSGGVEMNANIFLRDSSIGAFGLPQYETQFFGGEMWLNLNYNTDDLNMGVRFDMYNNSNLRDPNDSYTDQGLGRWFLKKDLDKLTFEAGYLYDQIGSGIIYRAYELRPLFIDNSLLGGSIRYNITDNWFIKAFAGRQRNAFDLYGGNLKGIYSENFFILGDKEHPITLSPGIGFVNKTISDDAMERVVNILRSYLPVDRFTPKYNTYAFTIYNTLSYGAFSWFAEVSFKSEDAFFNPFADKLEPSGAFSRGKYVFENGSVVSSSLSYNSEKISLSIEAKRTRNFSFRMDPNARLLKGLISYIPPMNRQNTFRLTARYNPAIQEISEMAYSADLRFNWSDKLSTLINFSNMHTLEGLHLYREYFSEIFYKINTQWQLTGGLQIQNYNQEVYEEKPLAPLVKTITPYVEILYKLDRNRSMRVEMQYMNTEQDFGSWIFALVEFGIAPHWIFEVSGMYNSNPKKVISGSDEPKKALYPTAGVTYIKGPSRLQFRYVKQVEGVVCSGGICRLEPAFSGVRLSLTSNF